jgi:hypothetical protein
LKNNRIRQRALADFAKTAVTVAKCEGSRAVTSPSAQEEVEVGVDADSGEGLVSAHGTF